MKVPAALLIEVKENSVECGGGGGGGDTVH